MLTTEALPGWPPPAGESIGPERARAYIAWIRVHVRPLIREARRQLQARYPGIVTNTSAVTVAQLATWTLSDALPVLNIGVVWAEPSPGGFAVLNVNNRRDGRLELSPGLRMRD